MQGGYRVTPEWRACWRLEVTDAAGFDRRSSDFLDLWGKEGREQQVTVPGKLIPFPRL